MKGAETKECCSCVNERQTGREIKLNGEVRSPLEYWAVISQSFLWNQSLVS